MDATHTHDENSNSSNFPRSDIEIPLNHPPLIIRHADADAHETEYVFDIRPDPASSTGRVLTLMKRGAFVEGYD
jgi:hypothetical protein